MARKSKRKGREPDPSQDAVSPPLPMTHPDSAFSKFLEAHPEGARITYIGKDNQTGTPISLVSSPEQLQQNLRLVELGKSVAKGKRRGSSAKTIRRNVQICDLRVQDKRHWTHGQLGLSFGMNKRTVARILKHETKWRQLASELPD